MNKAVAGGSSGSSPSLQTLLDSAAGTTPLVQPRYALGKAPGDNQDWLLRVTGVRQAEAMFQGPVRPAKVSVFERFGIRYRHFFPALGQEELEYSYVGQTPEDEVKRPPTLEVARTTGLADYGLDKDLEWEGADDPAKAYFGIDADASGLEKERLAGADNLTLSDLSLNLQYDAKTNRVVIMSANGQQKGVFNLYTGKIVGSTQITQGYTSLKSYFQTSQNQPFIVEVNDGGRCASVGIMADYRTVAVKECGSLGEPPPDTPGVPVPPPFDDPSPPGGGNPPGGGSPPPGGVGDPFPPLEESGEGGGEPETTDPSQKSNQLAALGLTQNPGLAYQDIRNLLAQISAMQRQIDYQNERTAGLKDFIPRAEQTLGEGNAAVEDFAAAHGVEKPTKAQALDALQADLGFDPSNPQNGIANFEALSDRLSEALGAYNSASAEFGNKGSEGVRILQHTDGLRDAEAAMAFLSLYSDGVRLAGKTAVDIITAGGVRKFLKDALLGKIEEVTGEHDIGERAKEELKDALNTQAAAENFIDDVVDELPLPDREKGALKEALKEQFGESPEDLADPAAWVKAGIDVFVGTLDVGSEFQEDLEAQRQTGRALLSEALLAREKALCLLMTLQNLCAQVDAAVSDFEAEVERMKATQAEKLAVYSKEKNALLDLVAGILNDATQVAELMADNPSQETLKQRLKAKIIECLQIAGLNLDLVNLDFEVTIEVKATNEDGSLADYTWEITNFSLALK